MNAVLDRHPRHRGRAALQKAITEYAGDHLRSEHERDFRRLIAESTLPMPHFNTHVPGASNGLHEVDAHWPDHKLCVELHSYRWHRTPRRLEHDAAKTADLELAGQTVVHLHWDDTHARAQQTLRRMAARLEVRRAA